MTGSVLIVDDSLTVRMDLLEAFQSGGFHATPCATLTEARQILARDPVDILVLDVLLPDGDGVDFLSELRTAADYECTTVLILSTEAEVKDRVRGLRTGAEEYIGKPYDAGYVVATARRLMRPMTPTATTPTVLLIENSLASRSETRRYLEQHAYTVVTADSGEEGLRLAADLRPEAIIVDDVLPGIDGAALIRRVRLDAALRYLPCLLLTVSTDRDTEIRVLGAGADAFVGKDEDPAVVVSKLAAMLRQSGVTAPADEAGSLYGPKKVLAVDDSETYLQAIAASLRSDGYEVVLAHSGGQALELLAEETVDCILLDLQMPGLNGRETCERIKSAAPVVREIPLIMMTALDDADAMLQGLQVGADDYIRKPDDLEILKARVRAQIRRKHFQDENCRIREELYRKETEAAEARAARELAETRAALVEELKWRNQELEAFSYSVSHDLRGPLQAVTGFSEVLLNDCPAVLNDDARQMLERIHLGARRMSELVVALLQLSHASRGTLVIEPVDLTAMCEQVAEELGRSEPGRTVRVTIAEGLQAQADPGLLRVLMVNLLGNAWKFTRRTEAATIEVGQRDSEAYFVRDNGAGFPAADAVGLFEPFRRLHSAADFPGTGIGLATVHRIVDRHSGRIWAAGEVGRGATFHFTLGSSPLTGDTVVPDPA
jgi:DNA-binding response OmpR family regulator